MDLQYTSDKEAASGIEHRLLCFPMNVIPCGVIWSPSQNRNDTPLLIDDRSCGAEDELDADYDMKKEGCLPPIPFHQTKFKF
jgi:hypothetical protein